MGFGAKVNQETHGRGEPFYGEWELGTYAAAWRIIKDGHIICGSMDVVDTVAELDAKVQSIEFGAFSHIEQISDYDVRVKLDNGVFLDFICTTGEDDEMFHIFGPEHLYLEFRPDQGWIIGKSNAPWSSA